MGDGTLGKDVKDERRPVDHDCPKLVFHIAQLGRRQLVVEDDNVCLRLNNGLDDFLEFALADVGFRMWMCQFLTG